jgi:hypothetical protein
MLDPSGWGSTWRERGLKRADFERRVHSFQIRAGALREMKSSFEAVRGSRGKRHAEVCRKES